MLQRYSDYDIPPCNRFRKRCGKFITKENELQEIVNHFNKFDKICPEIISVLCTYNEYGDVSGETKIPYWSKLRRRILGEIPTSNGLQFWSGVSDLYVVYSKLKIPPIYSRFLCSIFHLAYSEELAYANSLSKIPLHIIKIGYLGTAPPEIIDYFCRTLTHAGLPIFKDNGTV